MLKQTPAFSFLLYLCMLLLSHGAVMAAVSKSNLVQGNAIALKADTSYLASLLKNAQFYVNKPGNAPADISSSLSLATKAINMARMLKNLKGEGEALLIMSQANRENGDAGMALKQAKQALLVFQHNLLLKQEQAEAYMAISDTYSIDNEADVNQKIENYRNAIMLLRQSNANGLQLANALKYMGDLYNVKDDAVTCVNYLREAIRVYKLNRYEKLQDIYCLLGAVLNYMGNSKDGLKYLLMAAGTATKFKDSSLTVVTLYNRLGTVYNSLNQLQNANSAFKQSLLYARHNKDRYTTLYVSANLGWSYIRIKQSSQAISVLKQAIKNCPATDTAMYINLNTTLLEAYLDGGQLQQALVCYTGMEKIARWYPGFDYLMVNYHNAATKLFLELKQYDKVKTHIGRYLQIAKATKNIRDMAAAEFLSFKLDSALKQPWLAIAHYKEYNRLSDSLDIRNHDREIAQFQSQYESEKKDADIAEKAENIIYLRQQAVLQKRAFNSERLARNLSVGGMALLAMLLALGYNRFLIKKKANIDLEEKQKAINAQNEALKKLLTEREWLLKEVHHRVKNNLQIVISLLDTQSVYLTDDNALGAIRESQHRMNCISLVHQKLYQDENLAGIEMHHYLSELIGYMQQSFDTAGRIRFTMDVEHLHLDVSQAVPLGLILNEAFTNAIKYAFNGRYNNDCRISVMLKQTANDMIDIHIEDNGSGLPNNFELDSCTSLGMNLIQGLCSQLHAQLNIVNNNGLSIQIKLPKLEMLNNRRRDAEMHLLAS